MPPKFRKSPAFNEISPDAETEVLDFYAELLDSTGSEDVFLRDIPELLSKLRIPSSYTDDVVQCIEYFYLTRNMKSDLESPRWGLRQQLLKDLTITSTIGGVQDVSDVVDIDKLVKFGNRHIKFRDNENVIDQGWKLFVDVCKVPNSRPYLTLKDLTTVKSYLRFDDISESILIDMLRCSKSPLEGKPYNYNQPNLQITKKDFAEILGQLGKFD